jgi:hypothetical protein
MNALQRGPLVWSRGRALHRRRHGLAEDAGSRCVSAVVREQPSGLSSSPDNLRVTLNPDFAKRLSIGTAGPWARAALPRVCPSYQLVVGPVGVCQASRLLAMRSESTELHPGPSGPQGGLAVFRTRAEIPTTRDHRPGTSE